MPKKIRSSTNTILRSIEKESLSQSLSYPQNDDCRPKTIIPIKTNIIIAFSIFLFTMLIYQMTNAKSISFWDSGEYIACSSILGIPHPPGNPFFIILGRFVSIFSFGFDHAAVISFLASLFGALGVMFTYLFTVQLLSMWEEEKFTVFLGGFVASMLTGFSFSYWMNSVEAAVYTGMVFIINISIWLILLWVKKQREFSHQNILLLIVYLLFLGFGIHQTALQIAPAILFIAVFPFIRESFKSFTFWGQFVLYLIGLLVVYIIFDGIGISANIPELAKLAFGASLIGIMVWHLRNHVCKKAWLLGLLMLIIAFSTHLFLFIRSGHRPFINEGHPHNLSLFMDYIMRRQYVPIKFLERRASFSVQVFYHFLRYYTWQFMDVGVVANWFKMPFHMVMALSNLIVTFLGISGFYYAFKKNKNTFWYLFALFFMTTIAMVFVMNLSDEEVRDRDYFFLTAYNIWAVAMGIGAVGLIKNLTTHTSKILKYILSGLLLLYPMFNMLSQYHKHDRTGEHIALGYGLNLLNGLEENAIIFTNGDNDTFPIWYVQAVFDKNAIEHVYPAENVFPNSTTLHLIERGLEWKNSHIKGIRRDVVVANLSLLNTPWYLKQLKDMDGIELNWTDEQIDRLRPTYLSRSLDAVVESPNGERFTIVFPEGSSLAVKDFAVARIIQDNFGKRPIYFASTVPEYSGFEDYLVNEGMVSRVVSTPEKNRTNYERTKNNLNHVYFYGGVFNEKLYKDDNKIKMISNYGAAHLRLADYYQNIDDFENSLDYFNRAMEFVLDPNERIRFNGTLAISNAEAGHLERAEELIKELMINMPNSAQPYLVGTVAMFRGGEPLKALEYIDMGLEIDPFNRQLIALAFQIGFNADLRDEANEVLTKILPYQPHIIEFLEVLMDSTKTINDL